MSKLSEYLDIKNRIIRPALEKLKKEYDAQGYRCSIGSQGHPVGRSSARDSGRDSSSVRSAIGPISLSRRQGSNVPDTVSIYFTGSDAVIIRALDVLDYESVLLDDITLDRVKEEVRKVLD